MTKLEETRQGLRSDKRQVLVIAPAGCGKTYEACQYALEATATLAKGRRVLFLAHTNAAIREFRRRTREQSVQIDASTIDAFCLELLAPYATRLGLPSRLKDHLGKGSGRVPFRVLAASASDLLNRCYSIATLYAYRYPVIILDEHQDASPAQHAVMQEIAAAGDVRIRMFGDPMQAIYGDDELPVIKWGDVEASADLITHLDEPQRWKNATALGGWIVAARERLQLQGLIPAVGDHAPVFLYRINAADPGPKKLHAPEVTPLLHKLLNKLGGSMAVLARYNPHVLHLQVLSKGRLRLNEGVEFEDAYRTLDLLECAVGKPAMMARRIVAAFDKPSCGVTKERWTLLKALLGNKEIGATKRRELQSLLGRLQRVYTTPDVATACAVIGEIAEDPPDWLAIRHPSLFRVLGSLRPSADVSPKDCLHEAIQRHKRVFANHSRCVSTVHKAKGMEFDHIILANFGAEHFVGDLPSRQVAYVALSRACRSLHIIVPAKTPSPLLGS